MEFPKSFIVASVAVAFSLSTVTARADATATALQLAGTITGGLMPVTAPEFSTMVAQVQSGNVQGAALTAAQSSYFASYLGQRLAFEMQNAAMDPTQVPNPGGNDSTLFLLAHYIQAGGAGGISTIWSENATYTVSIGGVSTHAADITAAQLATLDFRSAIVRTAGQNAVDLNGNAIAIPAMHVGGFVTLSDRTDDGSFAEYGATAGTNLRMIEGIYETAFGDSLTAMASTNAMAQNSPRFVPEDNINFFHGQGQAACISCHGGGASSVNHGYSAVADIFDFDTNNGFTYIAAPTTGTKKSLGSMSNDRSKTLTCNMTTFTTCNPDSIQTMPNFGWDVGTTWSESGLLAQWGWKGPTTGNGLNSLGVAIGQSSGVYDWLAQRVINEICPLDSLGPSDVAAIAAQGQATDDLRTIVAAVAASPSCHF